MSWLGEAFSYFRRLTLLDHKVEQMTKAVDKMRVEVDDQGDRLVRVETILELNGYPRPAASPPRLPRG